MMESDKGRPRKGKKQPIGLNLNNKHNKLCFHVKRRRIVADPGSESSARAREPGPLFMRP